MFTLTPKMVHYQPTGNIPEDLIIWQDENCGIPSFTAAAKDILAGKTVSFAVCTTQPHQSPEVVRVVYVALGSDGPRFCGENKDPEGPGSHALIGPYYDYCMDETSIAVALALTLNINKDRSFRLA